MPNSKPYKQKRCRIDQIDAVAAVREGLEAVRRGRGRQASKVLEQIRKKHKIPKSEYID